MPRWEIHEGIDRRVPVSAAAGPLNLSSRSCVAETNRPNAVWRRRGAWLIAWGVGCDTVGNSHRRFAQRGLRQMRIVCGSFDLHVAEQTDDQSVPARVRQPTPGPYLTTGRTSATADNPLANVLGCIVPKQAHVPNFEDTTSSRSRDRAAARGRGGGSEEFAAPQIFSGRERIVADEAADDRIQLPAVRCVTVAAPREKSQTTS